MRHGGRCRCASWTSTCSPINDRHGHIRGDEVLRQVAAVPRLACAQRRSPRGSAAKSSRCCCQCTAADAACLRTACARRSPGTLFAPGGGRTDHQSIGAWPAGRRSATRPALMAAGHILYRATKAATGCCVSVTESFPGSQSAETAGSRRPPRAGGTPSREDVRGIVHRKCRHAHQHHERHCGDADRNRQRVRQASSTATQARVIEPIAWPPGSGSPPARSTPIKATDAPARTTWSQVEYAEPPSARPANNPSRFQRLAPARRPATGTVSICSAQGGTATNKRSKPCGRSLPEHSSGRVLNANASLMQLRGRCAKPRATAAGPNEQRSRRQRSRRKPRRSVPAEAGGGPAGSCGRRVPRISVSDIGVDQPG